MFSTKAEYGIRVMTHLARAADAADVELRPVWKGFFIRPQSINQEHQARFTLIDKKGFQRIGFPGDQATPEQLAALAERGPSR